MYVLTLCKAGRVSKDVTQEEENPILPAPKERLDHVLSRKSKASDGSDLTFPQLGWTDAASCARQE